MAKRNQFNVPVNEKIAEEFDNFIEGMAGTKGQKLEAALKAIQALCLIDEGIMFDLMNASTTVKDAQKVILERVAKAKIEASQADLSPKQQSYLQQLAEETAKHLRKLK